MRNLISTEQTNLNQSTIFPRLGTEVFSLIQDQILSSANHSTQFNLNLPNSLFINGIVLSHDNFTTCDKIQIGKNEYFSHFDNNESLRFRIVIAMILQVDAFK